MENRLEVIEHLRSLGKEGSEDFTCICDSISHVFGHTTKGTIQNMMLEWPKADINEADINDVFVVPGETYLEGTVSSSEAFHITPGDEMWVGEYGDNRRELCFWLADELEKEL